MSLPAPYYQDDWVTIYHGDCRELLPAVEPVFADPPYRSRVDLLLTDPPYGINFRSTTGQRIHGDENPFDPTWLLESYKHLVLFGANYFAHLLPPGGWLVWSKRQDNRDLGQFVKSSTAEVAWTNMHRRVDVFNFFWGGGPFLRAPEERGYTGHPTIKPVALMRWIVGNHSEPGATVLDPYMGTGPVGQACRDLERRYVGIEIEEKYCEMAVARLAQDTLPLETPALAPAGETQPKETDQSNWQPPSHSHSPS